MTVTLTIGRDTDNDIVIGSPYLSSTHARIEVVNMDRLQFRITDLGSTNGTYVNGVRADQALVTPRDVVRFGEYTLEPELYIPQFITALSPTSSDRTGAPGWRLGIFVAVAALAGAMLALLVADFEELLPSLVQLATLFVLVAGGLVLSLYALRQKRAIAADRRYEEQRRQALEQRLSLAVQEHQQSAARTQFAWNGFRKFQVERRVPESSDICSFYLRAHDGLPIPAYFPGQYLTFRLRVPEQSKAIVRCYSLSDAPRSECYRVSIKKVAPPPDKPDVPWGVSSSYFHDQLREGDIVDVKMPSGSFFLDPGEQRPVVLIGGGIGVTPMLAMLNTLVEAKSNAEIWFFYGVRNSMEVIQGQLLKSLAEAHDHLRLIKCFSKPSEKDELHVDYQHAGRVSVELLQRLLPSNNYRFYLCGPGPFMAALTEGLQQWSVPAADILTEAFGPSSVLKKSAQDAATPEPTTTTGVDQSHQVTFAKAGIHVTSSGNETLLELAEANGVALDYGCRAGNCGTCLVAIKEGTVRCDVAPDAAVEAGSCLACISRPASPLIIEA